MAKTRALGLSKLSAEAAIFCVLVGGRGVVRRGYERALGMPEAATSCLTRAIDIFVQKRERRETNENDDVR